MDNFNTKFLVPEKGPRIQTSRFEPVVNKSWEYNDRTDSYQEVPKDYIGTAKQAVEIIGFGDPVAQPGQYVPSVCKDNPEAYTKEGQGIDPRPPLTAFEQEVRKLINRYSIEKYSNTPDFILAEYLSGCLNAFNYAVQRREVWYGRVERQRE